MADKIDFSEGLESEYGHMIIAAIQARDYYVVDGSERIELLAPISIYDTNSASSDGNQIFEEGLILSTIRLDAETFFRNIQAIEDEYYVSRTVAFKLEESPLSRVKLSVGFSDDAMNLYKQGDYSDLEIYAFNPAEVAFLKLKSAERKTRLIFEANKSEFPDRFQNMTFEDYKQAIISAKKFGNFQLKDLPGISTYEELCNSTMNVLDRNGEVIKNLYGDPITAYEFAMKQRIPDDRKSLFVITKSQRNDYFSTSR